MRLLQRSRTEYNYADLRSMP
eukprot:COSAG03_NODE_16161_length_410_cov_0.662379_1_plen_20_part_10